MGWAIKYIEQLKSGKTTSFRPTGRSMRGKIESGQLVTVMPIKEELKVNDIVLCRVKGNDYLHLITAISSDGRYQIGNNRGGINGWIGLNNIFGKCIKIE